MTASARMRRRATGKSTLAVNMYITAPVKTAVEHDHTRRARHHHIAAITSIHRHYASCGNRQNTNAQSQHEPVRQSVCLVHIYLSFVEAIKHGTGFRNTSRRDLIINCSILAPGPTLRARDVNMPNSPGAKSSFSFIFIPGKLISYGSLRNGVFTPFIKDYRFKPAPAPGILKPFPGVPASRSLLMTGCPGVSLHGASSMPSSVPRASRSPLSSP